MEIIRIGKDDLTWVSQMMIKEEYRDPDIFKPKGFYQFVRTEIKMYSFLITMHR